MLLLVGGVVVLAAILAAHLGPLGVGGLLTALGVGGGYGTQRYVERKRQRRKAREIEEAGPVEEER